MLEYMLQMTAERCIGFVSHAILMVILHPLFPPLAFYQLKPHLQEDKLRLQPMQSV